MAEEYKNTNTEFTPTHDESTEVKDRGMFDFLKKKKEEEKKPEQEQQVEAMTSELHHVQVDDHPEKKADYFHQDEEDKEKKPSLLEKFHRDDHSSSSSSSDEEVEENGEKIRRKKNKKGLKEKIKEKFGGDHDTSVPIEKCDDELMAPPPPPPAYGSSYPVAPEHEEHHHEKSDFIEKIQEKLDHDELPGGVHHAAPQEPTTHVIDHGSVEPEEKKGFLEKIKEKFPGGHKKQVDATEVAAPAHHAPVEYSSTTDEHHVADAEPGKEKKGILEKIKEKLPGYHKTEDEHKEKEKDKEGHY